MALPRRKADSLEDAVARISEDVSVLSELMGETATEEVKTTIRRLR